MPESIAVLTILIASASLCDANPMCQPPKPIADTRSPVRPRMRYFMNGSFAAALQTTVHTWSRKTTMALTDYLTIGHSGLRVSPFCLGAMTFGEDWGWGSSVAESEAIIARFLERGGNFIDTANVYTKGHSERIIGDLHRARSRPARSRRHRHQVLRQSLPRRSEWRRRRSKDHRRLLRAVPAPAADRLHRSLLDALLGSLHADRGDDARARRPRASGEGALHRLLGHAGVESVAGPDDRPIPRLGAARRAADRVLAARAHGRRRADSDGARNGAWRHAVVAAQERRAVRASTRARTRRR